LRRAPAAGGGSFSLMTCRRLRGLAAVAAVGGAAILFAGCGGSSDSTTSQPPAQAGAPAHAMPLEHPSGHASEPGSAKRRKRASSQTKHQPVRKPARAAKPKPAGGPASTPSAKQAEDAVAKIKELVAGSGGGKQRTVSNSKQIREVLKELSDQSGDSGDSTSGGRGSGRNGSPSGVEEILESLGGG